MSFETKLSPVPGGSWVRGHAGHGSAKWWVTLVTGHKMWPIVISAALHILVMNAGTTDRTDRNTQDHKSKPESSLQFCPYAVILFHDLLNLWRQLADWYREEVGKMSTKLILQVQIRIKPLIWQRFCYYKQLPEVTGYVTAVYIKMSVGTFQTHRMPLVGMFQTCATMFICVKCIKLCLLSLLGRRFALPEYAFEHHFQVIFATIRQPRTWHQMPTD